MIENVAPLLVVAALFVHDMEPTFLSAEKTELQSVAIEVASALNATDTPTAVSLKLPARLPAEESVDTTILRVVFPVVSGLIPFRHITDVDCVGQDSI